MRVTTYVLVLLVASLLGTVWLATDLIDAVMTTLIVWIIPAGLAGALSRGGRGYYVWPSIVWLIVLSFLWVGATQ